MFDAQCPKCGYRQPIFFESYFCPLCRTVSEPSGWSQRTDPRYTEGAAPRRSAEVTALRRPERSGSTEQRQWVCEGCSRPLPPWALYCVECGTRTQ